jgi:ecdysteroid kinase
MTTAADLTGERLTELLAPHLDGAAITHVEQTPVGTGQMGDCVRLALTTDRPAGLPPTLVAKIPSTDETSRATGAALRSYEIEVSFYRSLLPTLDVRVPHCYHADYDPVTADFLLLLEDVAPACQGDQLTGCSVDQAAIAVNELPGLHAPRWGDRALERLDWLHRNSEESGAFLATLISGMFPGFCDRYADRLDGDVVKLAERMTQGLRTLVADRPRPWTVTHGDYRPDNLLFGTTDDASPVVVVDWQTGVLGAGVADLSYLLGAGLVEDDRRSSERDLVRLYQDGMRARGVDLAWDELWDQYRRFSFGGLVMAIAASMLVERTERGDEMFITMARRHGQHALDLEATDFLG